MSHYDDSDLDKWVAEAVENGSSHIIVVCDTFEYDDYPVYVKAGEDLREARFKYDGRNMQMVETCREYSRSVLRSCRRIES